VIRTLLKFTAFTVVCMVFTGYLAFTIGNIRLFEQTYTLSATFDDVTGLLPDDNVKVAGVVVGKVTGISIEKGKADVTFSVRDDVRVPSDSTAAIRWRNLLGQRYLYLYPGTSSTVLTSGDEVGETRSVVDLGELFNRLGPIVAAIDPQKVNDFLDTIVEALDGRQDDVGAILDDLAALTTGLATRDEAIGRLITNLNTVAGTIDARDQQIRVVLDNLVTLAGTFSANTDVLDAAITELGDASGSLDTLLSTRAGEIDSIIANLVTVLRTVEDNLDLVDSAVAALPAATVKIFAAGRHGQWLNQVIPCAAFEPWDGESVPPCKGAITGLGNLPEGLGLPSGDASAPGPRPAASQGADAVTDLLAPLVGGS
jgi:phospholipid/cholesterol/gamma-HCH transport system substrate-binding protein